MQLRDRVRRSGVRSYWQPVVRGPSIQIKKCPRPECSFHPEGPSGFERTANKSVDFILSFQQNLSLGAQGPGLSAAS